MYRLCILIFALTLQGSSQGLISSLLRLGSPSTSSPTTPSTETDPAKTKPETAPKNTPNDALKNSEQLKEQAQEVAQAIRSTAQTAAVEALTEPSQVSAGEEAKSNVTSQSPQPAALPESSSHLADDAQPTPTFPPSVTVPPRDFEEMKGTPKPESLLEEGGKGVEIKIKMDGKEEMAAKVLSGLKELAHELTLLRVIKAMANNLDPHSTEGMSELPSPPEAMKALLPGGELPALPDDIANPDKLSSKMPILLKSLLTGLSRAQIPDMNSPATVMPSGEEGSPLAISRHHQAMENLAAAVAGESSDPLNQAYQAGRSTLTNPPLNGEAEDLPPLPPSPPSLPLEKDPLLAMDAARRAPQEAVKRFENAEREATKSIDEFQRAQDKAAKESSERVHDLTGRMRGEMEKLKSPRPSHFGLNELLSELSTVSLLKSKKTDLESKLSSLRRHRKGKSRQTPLTLTAQDKDFGKILSTPIQSDSPSSKSMTTLPDSFEDVKMLAKQLG